jgi:hypothetical protein
LLSVMGQIMIVDNALKNAFKGDYVSVDKHWRERT